MSPLNPNERNRLVIRRTITTRGPEAGREVDHLKAASLGGTGEALLERWEAGTIGTVTELSRRDGDSGALLFMYDLSAYDGADVYGG